MFQFKNPYMYTNKINKRKNNIKYNIQDNKFMMQKETPNAFISIYNKNPFIYTHIILL